MGRNWKSTLERIAQPEYTGSNRCLPCTLVNVGIATALGVVGTLISPPVGVLVFGLALATIWLRGYLIPGTPALTKRYAPGWLLERFDHASSTRVDDSDVDVETYLTEIGAIVDDPAADDVALHPEFESDWRACVDELRETTADRTALAALLGVPPAELEFRWYDAAFVARLDDEWIGQRESRSAFVADVAASRTLDEWEWAPDWQSIPLARRSEIVGALRIVLERCPTCDGEVRFEREVVESCCRRYDVVAANCAGCDDRLLEVSV